MLQQATGLSYHQVRRILQGFQFDAGRCRAWAAELTVWPEDERRGLPAPSDDRLQHLNRAAKGFANMGAKRSRIPTAVRKMIISRMKRF